VAQTDVAPLGDRQVEVVIDRNYRVVTDRAI